jgi:membrane dipeptidase
MMALVGADDMANEPAGSELIRQTLVWDAHSGFMPDPSADLENLALWRDSQVDFLSINVGFDLMPWHACVATIAAFRRWLFQNQDRYLLAQTVNDIAVARASNRMAVAFDLEGMVALDGRIEMVQLYRDLGVRQMLFAYNRNNAAGGGCHDADGGLTDFGRAVIAEMNRVGMVVDVSHAGYRTSMEAMEASQAPVIFSHSNPFTVQPHQRNITDEQIRACAATGGVVCAVGINLFLGDGPPTANRLADHVDYLIDVAGPHHVALGLDFGFPVELPGIERIVADNPAFWPTDQYPPDFAPSFFAPSGLPDLADELLCRGHRESVVEGVLGGNMLRVAQQAWR